GVSNRALAPKVLTGLLANGTRSASATTADSASSQAAHVSLSESAVAFATVASYLVLWMPEKFVPFGAAGPDRNGTTPSGLLTLSGTQAMSQSPAPKIVSVSADPARPRAVTLTPAACHC